MAGFQAGAGAPATLFAANLPFDATEQEVSAWFAPVGQPIRIAFSKSTETGRPRGIAFITFPSRDLAEAAIRNLCDQPLRGRKIHLDWSKERDRGAGRDGQGAERSGAGGGPGAGRPGPSQGYQAPAPSGYAAPQSAPPGQYPMQQQHMPPQVYQGQQLGPAPTMYAGAPHQPTAGAPAPGQPANPAGTIIITNDGRRIMLAPGQALPAGVVTAPGAMPIQGGVPGQQQGVAGQPGQQQQQQPGQQPVGMPYSGGVPPGAPQGPSGPPMGPPGVPVMEAPRPINLKQDFPVGVAAAQSASAKVAQALGAPNSNLAPSQQAATSVISGMTPKQMYDVLRDLRGMIEANPERGRAVLRENPSLTKAVFQAQILLGMVDPDAKPAEAPAAEAEEKIVKMEAGGAPPAQEAPAPAQQPSNTVLDEKSQVLLRQVLQMSDADIALCSPEQQEQIRLLKQYAEKNSVV